MMTWALSLVPIMAMSVRILFTSHDRCWSVVFRSEIGDRRLRSAIGFIRHAVG
jgi:hypothetical protein